MKFSYQGSEYDLVDIIGKENIFLGEKGEGLIISKAGMVLLMGKFPSIDCTFGEVEHVTLKGKDVLAVQACAFNRDDQSLSIGRDYGELSEDNADEFGLAYPIATIINRARNRAVLRHLGVNAISEEELAGIPLTPRKKTVTKTEAPVAPVVDDPEERTTLLAQIKEACTTLGWDNAKRIRLYCVALGIEKDTPAEKVKDLLTNSALRKALDILKGYLKGNG